MVLCSACASKKLIPNVDVYKEIPFIDAPEGVAIKTLTKEERLISAPEWAKLQPVLLCVDDKGWAAIQKGWLAACRYVGKKCEVEVETVATMIKELDKIAEAVYKTIPR